jgi:hypothetical protein
LKFQYYFNAILQYPRNKGYLNKPIVFEGLPFSRLLGISITLANPLN